MKTHGYLEGHVGDLILLTAFLASLTAFVVLLLKGHESQILGSIALASLASLGTNMTKRPAPQTTVENVEKITVEDQPKE